MAVSNYVNSIWNLQKPFIAPSETSKAMKEVWPKQLPGSPLALSLFTLPLAPHQKKSSLEHNVGSCMEGRGCCKPVPPSRVGPGATCSGCTRQTQSHKDSFGLFATRQDAGVLGLLGLAGPTVTPHHRAQVWHSGKMSRVYLCRV